MTRTYRTLRGLTAVVALCCVVAAGNLNLTINEGCKKPHTKEECEHSGNLTPDAFSSLVHIFEEETPEETKSLNSTHVFISNVKSAPTFVIVNATGALSLKWVDDEQQQPVPTFEKKEGELQAPQAARLLTLIKFDDPNDHADVEHGSNLQRLHMHYVLWDKPTKQTFPDGVVVEICSIANQTDEMAKKIIGGGKICLNATVYETSGRDNAAPRLMHSEGHDVHVSVSLKNLTREAHTRFTLELELISAPVASGHDLTFRLIDEFTLNDQYTPAVFRETHIQSFDMVDCVVRDAVSYFLWTPVAFREASKERSTLTQTSTNRISTRYKIGDRSGILKSESFNDAHTAQANVTLGYPGDKFYQGYLTWEFAVGYGAPSIAGLSPWFYALVVTALVIPAATGITYLVYKYWWLKRASLHIDQQTLINDN